MSTDIKKVAMQEVRIALPVTIEMNEDNKKVVSNIECPPEFLGLPENIQASVFNGLFNLVSAQVKRKGGDISTRQEVPDLKKLNLPMTVLANLRLTRAPSYQMEAEINFPDECSDIGDKSMVFLLTAVAKLYISSALTIAGKKQNG